jgi:thiol-disulfide isomerase/thioredoxin
MPHHQPSYSSAGTSLLLVGLMALCCNATPPDDAERRSPLRIQLVDADGRPVRRADVGLYTYYGDVNFSERTWKYEMHIVSGEDGVVQYAEKSPLLKRLALIARHADRKLVAIESLDPSDSGRSYTVRMHPACRVVGELACKQLEAEGKSLQGINVNVFKDGKYAIEYWCNRSSAFEFVMPPGDYEMSACSDLSGTHEIVRTITIPAGKPRHDLGTFDLPLTALTRLQGKMAPELRDVVAWKNCRPVTLAELRGQVVLLEFWGWWCGACLRRMPQLFALHDKHQHEGLVIIGIHIDTTTEIDTVDELDKKLTDARESRWDGRDIPFPVAMVLGNEVPFPAGAARSATCAAAADYGICAYPTGVIIDREGRVAGKFSGQPDDIIKLKGTLNR